MSKDIKIHGKMALTERSCTTCMSFGGKISPVRPLAISVKRGAVSVRRIIPKVMLQPLKMMYKIKRR
ncbi:hypothetical protein DXB96_12710 [Clostridium sp. OM07-10AC]|nr:hypothetical protein DXC08_13360 [Clostridium sp. OM07-9AC]RHV01601.1 hypothetical protein DXB96_12710 [Clostridium sp. OM07-10AC]